MRILQLIQTNQKRGAENFASQISNHLIDAGHEVKIVALFSGTADLPFKGTIENLNASHKKRLYDYKSWSALNTIVKSFKPDVVQANAGDTLKYAVLSRLFFKWSVPIVFRNASELGRYITSTIQKKYNSFLFRKTDYIISVSQASKNDITKHFRFLENKTEVIPVGLEKINVIDDYQFEPKEAKHIVHVGGFTFEKNHEALLRIFQNVNREMTSTHLHLIGDGPLRTKIEKLVKEKGLSSNIHFHGFVNNPLNFIKSANVLVLPSLIEGLPGVLLEAMYCKTPVVAYNVGGISEIVDDETGYLIEKNNEENFSRAVVKIFENYPYNRIDTAYKMVIKQYINKKIAQDFIELYEKILKKN
ncbi:glycosyltransferase [Salinimicrobium sp. TIG7-5_MAKvit]|uniref:glycosyltransferase n=1 Tax=Salinimicrobium sp. TIG7-5_MAKvit TaxID=3121289 RepID=UPI003C6E7EE3